MPGFHDLRALSLHLYESAGEDGQKIASHVSEVLKHNYQRHPVDVIWLEVEADLDISGSAG